MEQGSLDGTTAVRDVHRVGSLGALKIGFVAHLEGNPCEAPADFLAAVRATGLQFSAINPPRGKQRPWSAAALESTLALHVASRFGARTLLVDQARAKLHGGVSALRLTTPLSSEAAYPSTVEVFWALGAGRAVPRRATFDAIVEHLARACPVRVATAGLVWFGIERPMLKDAPRVAEELLAHLRQYPHAHVSHRAKLDTTAHGLDPGCWSFLGSKHSRLQAEPGRLASFSPRSFAGGVSVALADEPPVASSPESLARHAALATALGPLYPAQPTSRLLGSVSIPGHAGFDLPQWLARYRDLEFLRALS